MGYTATTAQQEQFVNSLAKAMVTDNILLAFIETEHLVGVWKS
jgi:hypothetical protein